MNVGLPQRLDKAWREFVGPEATTTDTTVALGLAGVGAVAAPYVRRPGRRAGTWESLILRLFAIDLWGGAWVNNTKACARWYERPGQTDTNHLVFASLHLHPMVLAGLDRGESRRAPAWVWAGAHYGYLMASTLAIRRAPRWRRPLGAALTAGGVALDAALGPSRVAPWFAPVYYSKLLLGHASAALWQEADLKP